MHLLQAKKPQLIVLHTDNLLIPYKTMHCPFNGVRRYYFIPERSLFQLCEFITLLKGMESVEEGVMEGTSDPSFTEKKSPRIQLSRPWGNVKNDS